MPDADDHCSQAILQRIADCLGCPVEAFQSGHDLPAEVAQRHELLTLWRALRTGESREAVLKLVRTIVANE